VTDHVPTLQEFADIVEVIAQQAARVSNLPYKGQALAEIEEYDCKLSDGLVQNPVKFCHEMGGIYVQGAGDYLYGAARCAGPNLNLAFSSAVLVRSACEFSAWSWWIQDASIDATERVRRAMGIVRNDLNNPGNADQLGESGEELVEGLKKWADQQAFKVPGGAPKITETLKKMNPEFGGEHYKYLSGITHGRFTELLRVHHQVRHSREIMQYDHWARLLIGARTVLQAMDTICILRAQSMDDLGGLHQAVDYYENEYARASGHSSWQDV
jgi:hypothetical protein